MVVFPGAIQLRSHRTGAQGKRVPDESIEAQLWRQDPIFCACWRDIQRHIGDFRVQIGHTKQDVQTVDWARSQLQLSTKRVGISVEEESCKAIEGIGLIILIVVVVHGPIEMLSNPVRKQPVLRHRTRSPALPVDKGAY